MTMTAEERAQKLADYPYSRESYPDTNEAFGKRIAAVIRAAEQEAAVQARSEADVKWANELGKLLADGEQVAEQRGVEREREACVLLMEDMREAECADAIRARGKQQEPASA